jgi:hypothetical protein
LVQKVTTIKTIEIPKDINIEVYKTSDGRQFEKQEDAEWHEQVNLLKKQKLKSRIINNEYLTQYIGKFRFVYFENENQVEAYEQKMCGNKDGNTWGSWLSCKEKFNFPCWIMCYYIPHSLCAEYPDDDFTAVYMTLDEVEVDLNNVLKQVDLLRIN